MPRRTVRSHGHGLHVVPKIQADRNVRQMPLCLGRVVTVVQSCRENAENGSLSCRENQGNTEKEKLLSARAAPGPPPNPGRGWTLPMGV